MIKATSRPATEHGHDDDEREPDKDERERIGVTSVVTVAAMVRFVGLVGAVCGQDRLVGLLIRGLGAGEGTVHGARHDYAEPENQNPSQGSTGRRLRIDVCNHLNSSAIGGMCFVRRCSRDTARRSSAREPSASPRINSRVGRQLKSEPRQ